MTPSAVAELVLKIIAGLVAWLRRKPPKTRQTVYVAGLVLAVLVLVAGLVLALFVPGFLALLKAAWLVVGPIVLLVVAGLARAHLAPATDDDGEAA